jgi:hypothetical protein
MYDMDGGEIYRTKVSGKSIMESYITDLRRGCIGGKHISGIQHDNGRALSLGLAQCSAGDQLRDHYGTSAG